MEQLASTSSQIENVVGLITDIADQTNLLALNATIEAARAAEAGKGFAVVASEVKSLANQTVEATSNISGQVAEVQSVSERSIDAMQSISSVIANLNDAMATISASVEEQHLATTEIDRSVQSTADGTDKVVREMSAVSAGAERAQVASSGVLKASDELDELAHKMREDIEEFLADVQKIQLDEAG